MTMLENWIGRQRENQDLITEMQVQKLRTTLDGFSYLDDQLLGMQWCLAPETLPPTDLGRDGHPLTGIFLPDLSLPRRMWAGGKLTYHRV